MDGVNAPTPAAVALEPITEESRLDYITSALLNMIAGIEDEGDRAYFGSTNDADSLREIAHEMDRARFAGAGLRG